MTGGKTWNISGSIAAKRTTNPIRAVVDQMKIEPNPNKTPIKLSIGDPTVFGNLPVAPEVVAAVTEALTGAKNNGYPHCLGIPAARAAIAERYGSEGNPIGPDDVCIASGCSGAIEIALGSIANEGDTILIPEPGFSLYQTVCDNKGIKTKRYQLNPDAAWEVDLESLKAGIDDSVVAMIINNPSNPCGSVYSKDHLEKILAIADEAKVPILADEIYADMTFEGTKFHAIAELTTEVPVISVGGLAKRYLAPGWRVGWILLQDHGSGKLNDVRDAVMRSSQVILGANSLIQAALPAIFANTPQSYYDDTMAALAAHSKTLFEKLSTMDGLEPIMPAGAMYMMVRVDVEKLKDIADDVAFTEKLFAEEAVMVLPGQCFGAKNFVRLVVCAPDEMLLEACERMEAFCKRHSA